MTGAPFTRKHELACRDVIYSHSQSFFLSSMLLPPDIRMCAWAVYGFCRDADDAVDDPASQSYSMKKVEELRERLELIYKGEASSCIDEAFSLFVSHYKIPRSIADCLLDGFETDASGVDLESEADLINYSFQVASTVGLMLTCAMLDTRSQIVLMKASDLGLAMQLTNIARDMGFDFRLKRYYLPRSIRERYGFEGVDNLSGPSESTRRMTEWLVSLSHSHYRSARQGIQYLPMNCRLAITASMYVYSAINDAIKANSFDNISSRAYVSTPKKFALVAQAMSDVIATPYESEIKSGPSDSLLKERLENLGLIDVSQSDLESAKELRLVYADENRY